MGLYLLSIKLNILRSNFVNSPLQISMVKCLCEKCLTCRTTEQLQLAIDMLVYFLSHLKPITGISHRIGKIINCLQDNIGLSVFKHGAVLGSSSLGGKSRDQREGHTGLCR